MGISKGRRPAISSTWPERCGIDCRSGCPAALFERLTSREAQLLSSAAAGPWHRPPDECVRALRRVRFEREQAAVQQDIDRLQTAWSRGARMGKATRCGRAGKTFGIVALASNESGAQGLVAGRRT
jgi:hypothetical protein